MTSGFYIGVAGSQGNGIYFRKSLPAQDPHMCSLDPSSSTHRPLTSAVLPSPSGSHRTPRQVLSPIRRAFGNRKRMHTDGRVEVVDKQHARQEG